MDSALSPGHWVTAKEGENLDKYLEFAKELKKLWNLKVIPIIVGAVGRISKKQQRKLELELKEESKPSRLQSAAVQLLH